MSPSELCHIKHCSTSNEVWRKLEEVYHSRGPARKATLLKQLLFTKMRDGGNMMDHLNNFFGTVDKLSEMEILVAEDLLAILLLYSIPDSFENFRCAIEARDELPTPEALKIKLLEEFNARKEKEIQKEQHSQGAFYAKFGNKNKPQQFKNDSQRKTSEQSGNPKIGNGPNFQQKNYKCNYCHKLGHKAADCWKKGNKKQSSSNVEEAFTAVMISKTDSIKEEILRKAEYIRQKNPVDSVAINEKASIAIAMNVQPTSNNDWCLDSGATSHMCHDRGKFVNFSLVENQKVRLAVDVTTEIIGKGTVHLTVPNGYNNKHIRLENTLCVPLLKTNLLSISKTTTNGYDVNFKDMHAVVLNRNGETVVKAERRGDLYYVEEITESTAAANSKTSELEKWHNRYGHLNEKDLKKLISKDMVKGVSLDSFAKMPFCEICVLGKQSATPFPQVSLTKSDKLLELVHSDVCGPMRTRSIGGAVSFVTFIDDKSRYVDVFFLKAKSEVKECFLKYKALAENETECQIKTLRTDNGLEYCGAELTKEIEQAGIRRERTVAHTPQQNGVAERMNRTLVEMARCLLIKSNLPPSFWAEAIATAAYIRNRCPSRNLDEITPFEARFGHKPDVSNLRTFGCKAYALNKEPGRSKLGPKSKPCIFMGYSDESKAYRLWDPAGRKIIKSRDVIFNEESKGLPNLSKQENFLEFEVYFSPPQVNLSGREDTDAGVEAEIQQEPENQIQAEDNGPEEQEEPFHRALDEVQPTQIKRGPGRPTKIKTGGCGRPRKRYNMVPAQDNLKTDARHEANLVSNKIVDPTVEEAMAGPHAKEWKKAMQSEFDALQRCNAWLLVERPTDKKVIGCRWVLRTKFSADGSVERRKARLVARGFSQQPGMDFQETFAPVARLSSIRILVALAAELGITLYQLDVVMAYINGDLDEELYMEQAEGFIEADQKKMVYSLKKSLYGLKQSGRQWFKKLDQKLQDFGLRPLNGDKCVYIMKSEEIYIILAVYVDDIIVGSNQEDVYLKLKKELTREFQIKDLGTLHYCLGIEFQQDPSTKAVIMHQRRYIEKILADYGMDESKPISTPLDGNSKLTKQMMPSSEEEIIQMKKVPYQSLIGTLMYLSVSTRPDISYTISVLSQFNINPGKAHWAAAKRVLRYLRNTLNHGLKFKKTNSDLVGYVDADWAGDIDDRVSHTGYVFKLADAAVTWEARKQKTIALSSTEAEYMALGEAAKETVYLRNLLKEIGFLKQDAGPTIVYCDNQGAQKLMRNPIYHSRTKHIDIKHHFIREVFQRGELDVKYTATDQMIADILTKGLFGPSHKRCIEGLGVLDVLH